MTEKNPLKLPASMVEHYLNTGEAVEDLDAEFIGAIDELRSSGNPNATMTIMLENDLEPIEDEEEEEE